MHRRTLFLDVVAATRPLLADPMVAVRWDEPSALAEMTVGALAGHLARAVTTVDDYVGSGPPTPEAPRLDAVDYWRSIDGLGGGDVDVGAAVHRAIRQRSEDAAAGGQGAVLNRWDAAAARLTKDLAGEPDDRMVAVYDGRVMRLDDYLVSRVIELMVHGDDLAVSLGCPTPPMPDGATEVVIATLVEIARRSHGDLAVVRALTRRERDDAEALRVL